MKGVLSSGGFIMGALPGTRMDISTKFCTRRFRVGLELSLKRRRQVGSVIPEDRGDQPRFSQDILVRGLFLRDDGPE
jgi:hypothetical protein